MNFSFARRGALVALAVAVAACTSPSDLPTGPTVTTFEPFLNPTPQVAGLFQGTMTLTQAQVTGGTGPLADAGANTCLAGGFRQAIDEGNNFNNASLTLTQDPMDRHKVTGRLTSESTGLACTYQGVIGSANGLILDAPAGACTAGQSLRFRCQPDGPLRTMTLVGSSI